MAFDNFKNFVWVRVAIGFDAAATTATLFPGDASRLPSVPFNLTCWNATDYATPSLDPDREILRVTVAPVGNNITFARAQQGTTATDKNIPDKQYVMIAGLDEDFIVELEAQLASLVTANTAADTRLDSLESTVTVLQGTDISLDARLDAAEGSITSLQSVDTATDARLDTAETNITALQSADAALDTRVDALEAGSGGGGLPAGWWDAKDNGMVGDGVTDDTAAFQSLLSTVSAAGGGTIYIPAGEYIIGGALQDTSAANAQIVIPKRDNTENPATINVIGALTPPTQFYSNSGLATPLAYTVLKSTLTGASGTAAMIASVPPAGAAVMAPPITGLYNNTRVNLRDLIFEVPPNPTFTCLNFEKSVSNRFEHVLVYTGSFNYTGTAGLPLIAEPTHSNSYGVKVPGNNTGDYVYIEGVQVFGHYTGIKFGELTRCVFAESWACKYGFDFPFTHHASFCDLLLSCGCQTAIIKTGSGTHYTRIGMLDIEHSNGDGGAWTQTVYDLIDASNELIGDLQFVSIAAGVGNDHTFTKNGGANMLASEVGADISGGGSLTFASASIGGVGDDIVDAVFNDEVKSVNYTSGFTITINGSPATISSAVRQTDKTHVHFTLGAPALGGDVLTIAYEDVDGFYSNATGRHLPDIAPTSVANFVGGTFDPSHLSGLGLWLRADSLAQANGTQVDTWIDESSNAFIFSNTGAPRPYFMTNVQNGLPVLRFGGGNQLNLTPDVAVLNTFVSSTGNHTTIFIVQKQTGTAANNSTFGWGAVDFETERLSCHLTYADALYFDCGADQTSGRMTVAQPAGWDDAFHVVELFRNGNAGEICVDNVVLSSAGFVGAPITLAATRPMRIGEMGGFFLTGDIAEMVIYKRALSSTERDQVRDYLNDKWAVY
jgi:hypothetical protein